MPAEPISATDRLEAALAAIDERNPDWHIVTHLDRAGAREAAAASDARRAGGEALGPLDGVIVGIKDNIAVRGLPWTAGLSAHRERIAERDATVTARLRQAGAVIVGMLNMHEGALGATTDNPTYGRAANPCDPSRTPGGSSGGSGAAVAAGFVEAALGSDTMGSVRIPAAYCGVLGLKPGTGRVPRDGLEMLSPSLDTIGPLAADPGILAATYAAIEDPAPRHRPAWPAAAPVLGIPAQLADIETEPEVAAAFDSARASFEAAGCRIRDIDLAGWDPGRARRGALLLVEAEGAVALADLLDRPGALSPELAALLDYGRRLSSARVVDGIARMRQAAEAARAAMGEVDMILMPTTPQRAFEHGGAVPPGQADLTGLANFAGLPALTLPVATPDGLPAGVQLVGPDNSEPWLLDLARRFAPRLAG